MMIISNNTLTTINALLKKQLSGDVATTAINQTTFYLAFLITLASAGAIIAQVIRGINARIKKNRIEAEARAEQQTQESKTYVDSKMREVNEVKDRVEYIYRRLVDEYIEQSKKKKGDVEGN